MFTVYRHYKCYLWILTSTAVSGSALSCFFLPLHGWNICLYSIKTKTTNQSFVFPQTPRIAEATERRQDPASPLQEVAKKGPLLCKTDVTDGKVKNKTHCALRFVFLPPPSHSTPQKMQEMRQFGNGYFLICLQYPEFQDTPTIPTPWKLAWFSVVLLKHKYLLLSLFVNFYPSLVQSRT